jgi:hypothetical protein
MIKQSKQNFKKLQLFSGDDFTYKHILSIIVRLLNQT